MPSPPYSPMFGKSWRIGFHEIIFKRDFKEASQTAHPFFLGPNLLQDPFARRGLSDLYQALTGASAGDLTSPERAQLVLRRIHQSAAAGELVSVRAKAFGGTSDQVSGGGGQTPPRRSSRTSSAPPPAASKQPEKTWVDIQLLDPDGTPVPGARYKLKITDGSVREGTLDDQGRVHVAGLDPGSCTVWFPDYDGKEWRPL